jgi:hypothetical protein
MDIGAMSGHRGDVAKAQLGRGHKDKTLSSATADYGCPHRRSTVREAT